MKKCLIGGLVLCLLLGGLGMSGCSDDDGNGDKNSSSRIVPEEYRGQFWSDSYNGECYKIIIYEKEAIRNFNSVAEDVDITTLPANEVEKYYVWTEPNRYHPEHINLMYSSDVNAKYGQVWAIFNDYDTLVGSAFSGTYKRKN